MDGRFTVRFFKRVITCTVMTVIMTLIVVVIVQAVRISSLRNGQKESVSTVFAESLPMDYQKNYSDLYVENQFENLTVESKTIYLTFDDGPSVNTEKVLDILKKCNVKATFFMVHNSQKEMNHIVQRVIDEGHSIGVHTYSHDYEKIYQSVDGYLEDFNKMWTYLKEEFQYETKIFRFPGGSVNSYNLAVYDKIIPEMYRRGFLHYDWNASAEDATSGGTSAERIVRDILKEVSRNDRSIVLMHDSAYMSATIKALPEIIETLQDEGYAFAAIDDTVKPVSFSKL